MRHCVDPFRVQLPIKSVPSEGTKLNKPPPGVLSKAFYGIYYLNWNTRKLCLVQLS